MNQETILIADYLSGTDDKQRREVIARYAQAAHLSIGRAEDMLDSLVYLMGFRRKAVAKGQTVPPLQRAA